MSDNLVIPMTSATRTHRFQQTIPIHRTAGEMTERKQQYQQAKDDRKQTRDELAALLPRDVCPLRTEQVSKQYFHSNYIVGRPRSTVDGQGHEYPSGRPHAFCSG